MENDKDSPESRYVLRGLLIVTVVAGLAILLVAILGHGVEGG